MSVPDGTDAYLDHEFREALLFAEECRRQADLLNEFLPDGWTAAATVGGITIDGHPDDAGALQDRLNGEGR